MGGRATEAQKQAFRALDQYGTDVAAVEASVELLQAEADRIICTNPRVMEEHRCVLCGLPISSFCDFTLKMSHQRDPSTRFVWARAVFFNFPKSYQKVVY